MESNPYTSPSANLFGSTQGTSAEGVPQEAIVQLQRTKPWLRFLGVLMWILVALMLLGALIVLVVAMIGAGEMMKGQTGGLGAGGLIGIAIAYALLSLIYIYPTLKLWKYGTFIGRLSTSRSADDLIAALNQQRAFWKFAGIMAILMIVFYIVMIVGMGVYGATAASALQGMGTDLPLPE